MEQKKPANELELQPYSLKPFGKNFVLYINDELSVCPFQTVNAGISTIGSPQFFHQPCCTKCPHARLRTENSETNKDEVHIFYKISCGSAPVEHPIWYIGDENAKVQLHGV